MSSWIEPKTGTSISQEHFNRLDEQQLIKQICSEYDVISVVKGYLLTKERKTELFLLGAVFSEATIRGTAFNIMIINKVMYILGMAGCSSIL